MERNETFYEYSLFEVEVIFSNGSVERRNFLVPSDDWQYYIDQEEKDTTGTFGRVVLLADKIQATSKHDFNYGAQ